MDKKIDDGWKDAVEKESAKREGSYDNDKKDQVMPEVNFGTFISSLAMEGLIFLGILPNPITKKKEENLEQASYVIETLDLLKKKTAGNLTAEEVNTLDNILYELRNKFIEKNK